MSGDETRIAFGPVPSRRLGQSIGINNIPPKICTYSCIYCQLGRTQRMQIVRKPFYSPLDVKEAVAQKIKAAKEKQEHIDYLTFVPDGEPTLDSNLGKEINFLKPLDIKIAVITNASLIYQKDVQDDLSNADYVSLKIDSVNKKTWKKINRPHGGLTLEKILSGLIDFSQNFSGTLSTETMLIKHLNDTTKELEKIADFIGKLPSKKSYISLPIRPPAESWVTSADEKKMNTAYQLFVEQGIKTECLIGYEGNAFAFTGNLEDDLLGIMSVHPIREEGVKKLLSKANADWRIIERLLNQQKIIQTKYHGKKFFIRNFSRITKNITNNDL